MNKYFLMSSVCAGWFISVSVGADNNASQTGQTSPDSAQMLTAIASDPEQTNTPVATPQVQPPSTKAGKQQKDAPYVTPLDAYNNNGVFGN